MSLRIRQLWEGPIKTGEIIEFVDDEIEKLQKKVAEKYGYNLVDHKLELYGVKKDSK